MKKLHLLKMSFLLCALMVGSGSVWADTYVRITSTDDLEAGADYLIVGLKTSTSTYYSLGTWNVGSKGKDYYAQSAAITVSSNVCTDIKSAHIVTLGGSSGQWTFYDKTDSKYLVLTNNVNGIQQATSVSDNTGKWTISFDDNKVEITNVDKDTRTLYYNTSATRFACYESAQAGGEVYLYKKLTITPAKTFTTYVPAVNLDFTSTDKLTAYIATAASGSAVTLTSVDKVPAGTPIVVKATQTGSAISVDYAATTSSVAGNKLRAGDGTTEIGGTGKYDYILKNGLFCKVTTASALAKGKCYLHLDSAPLANELTIDFDESGDVTGIQTVENQKNLFDGDFYNLAGQKVQNPTKGLYIVNGKKVVIK